MLDRTKDPASEFVSQGAVDLLRPDEIVQIGIIKKPSLLFILSKGLLQISLVAVILAGSIYQMSRLIKSKPETQARHAFKTVYTIKSVEVVRADHQPEFISYGQIEAARKVDLRSLVSGEVVAINANLQVGARVERGEPLVEIDKFSYNGALREAVAILNEAQARVAEIKARIVSEKSKLSSIREQLVIADRDLQRAKSLRQRGTVTIQQVEIRSLVVSQRQQSLNLAENMVTIENARLEQQKAAIERLQWRVTLAERNLENTVLKAPFTGIVRASSVDVGKLISANDIVVSLYEPGLLEASFTLTDAQYGRLQSDKTGIIGRRVKIIWTIGDNDNTYAGKIERLGAEIEPSRGGIEVFASLTRSDGQPELRPGAFVEIIVPDQQFLNSVRLPERAVYNGTSVYVINDGKLAKRDVTIVAYDGEMVLISSGLEAGEKVLITRIAEVSDGLNVREETKIGELDNDPIGPLPPQDDNVSAGADH